VAFKNLFSKKVVKRSSDDYDDDDAGLSMSDPRHDFWYQAFSAARRPAGQTINGTTASRVAAVFACCTAIAESVSMLPFNVMEQVDERNAVVKKDHPLWPLLHDGPNGMMDSFEFLEAMQRQALESGNAYASVTRSRVGDVQELLPLDAAKMNVKVGLGASGKQELVYTYTQPTGTNRVFSASEIFHLKPFTKDGLIGRTPIQVAADTVGFSLALLEHGNKLFENGAFHSGFIQAPHAFKDDDSRAAFMKSFKKYFGAKNAGKVALLEQGVTFKEASMNARDAQFLESKEFSVIEIARLFRCPPVMIQAMDKGMAFASVEQLAIMFVQYTIQPWITRWERAIKRQLLGSESDKNMYAKFNVSALLRGDMKARTEAIVQQLQYGLLTINEARNLEDRNPIEEEIGDKPLLSHNLRPADEPISEAGNQSQPSTIGDTQDGEDNTETPQEDNVSTPEPKAASKDFEATFRPLFSSIIGRYTGKSADGVKPERLRKLVGSSLEPAVLAYFDTCGVERAGELASSRVNTFIDGWIGDISVGGRIFSSQEQEAIVRTADLISTLR
jgi:HK97 family phage portal protein